MEPSGASKGPERSFQGSHGLAIAFVRSPFYSPPPCPPFKGASCLRKKRFAWFLFCGPGKAQENQGRQGRPYDWCFSPCDIFHFLFVGLIKLSCSQPGFL